MNTYDVELEAGDLPARTTHITGPDLVRQRIELRLGTFIGEWYLDTRKGLRYLEWLQQTPPRVEEIGADIRREIETTPDVLRVENWSGSFDGVTLSYSGDVIIDDGTVLAVVVTPTALSPGNTSAGSFFRIAQVPIARGFTT